MAVKDGVRRYLAKVKRTASADLTLPTSYGSTGSQPIATQGKPNDNFVLRTIYRSNNKKTNQNYLLNQVNSSSPRTSLKCFHSFLVHRFHRPDGENL
jgi:hypothetical protein